jgi:hypothetical protein
MRLLHLALALIASGSYGCATSGAPSNEGVPVTGLWGGVHAGLTLTETGGTISYDCAHGGLNAPVVPNGSGTFDVAGVHVPEHGGPIRVGEVPDSLPARYVGQVTRDRIKLRVLVGADTLGPFDLQLGVSPQLFRCL